MNIPTKEEMYKALADRHGETLQRALSQATVAICGLGGLGSNIAISLARCGVGHLHLIDFDQVDLANLNRQQYDLRHIGMNKTEALREQILEFAPYCEISISTVRMSENNIGDLVKDQDYICEAFDDAGEKSMLVNYVLEKMPAKVLVAASGMSGYGRSNEIKTRRITSKFYVCGDDQSESCDDVSLMSARVMICGAHQANAVIQLVGKKERKKL